MNETGMGENISLEISDYMQTLKPGSVLWEICATTLCELSREVPFGRVHSGNLSLLPWETPESRSILIGPGLSYKCVHVPTGQEFRSLKQASLFLNLHKDTVRKDIRSGRFKYGVYKL